MQTKHTRKRKTKDEMNPDHIPEYLRLPQGRVVSTRSLTNRATKSSYINVRTKTATDSAEQAARQGRTKYTMEERRWIATAEPRKILERYPHVVITYLKSFIKQSQDMVQAVDAQNSQLR